MFSNIDKMKDFKVGNITLKFRDLAPKIRERLEIYGKTDIFSRIFRKEPEIWIPDRTRARETPELVNRLGWLIAPPQALTELKSLGEFAKEISSEGYKDIVLLGMGGSSLAPEVFAKIFGNRKGFPTLRVLDSTHPGSIKKISGSVDLKHTLFIVSSKSGGTLETATLFKYFYDLIKSGNSKAGKSFVAITDPGSGLEKQAKELDFRKIFSTPPDVGGRYSALTFFGLVPAAIIGAPLETIVGRADKMMGESQNPHPILENSAAVLGVTLGELTKAGKNKLTFMISGEVSSLGAWIEQLIAESTGKASKGIVPIVDEPIGTLGQYGNDRAIVYIRLNNSNNETLDKAFKQFEASSIPTIKIDLDDKADIGGEFYRWEMATAVAGAVLGINPFDQPDVEATKIKTKEVMKGFADTGKLPANKPIYSDGTVELYSKSDLAGTDLKEKLKTFLKGAEKGAYVSLMAYFPYSDKISGEMIKIRKAISEKYNLPTTLGFGPRFLHSTGQLYKGDSGKGLFIQLTSDIESDLTVPGEKYSFGMLISAQAQADYRVMAERGRSIIRIHLNGDPLKLLKEFSGEGDYSTILDLIALIVNFI